MLLKKGKLLRIFINEKDKHKKSPLYEWIVCKARKYDLAGATVLRGLEGFGASRVIHTVKILVMSMDMPIVVKIIDAPEKIDEFLPIIDSTIKEGIATLEDVYVRFYRDG